jgi:hypothetical protein
MTEQAGLFTAQQAYAAQHTHRELQHLRGIGALVSVRRGVYARAADYLPLSGTAKHLLDTRALLLAVSAEAAVSHETGAVWTGLELLLPNLDELHVTRPELPASRVEAGVRHHAGSLPEDHVHEVEGARVTRPARTAVDIARYRDFPCGLAAVDSALRAGATAEEIRDVLFYCRAWAGARRASRAVSYGDGRAANPGESLSRAVLIEAGMPPTDLQVRIEDDEGLVGYADFGWLPIRVLGEFDGRGKYGADGSTAATVVGLEKRREDRFRALGYEVVRWGYIDAQTPGRVPSMVRAAHVRAGAPLGVAL